MIIILLFSSTLFADYYLNKGKKEHLTKLSSFEPLSKNRSAIPTINYYKTNAGVRLGVDERLIVSFSDISIQLYIEKEYALSLTDTLSKNTFVYTIRDREETLDVANALTELKGISYAHPDFHVQKEMRTNDPLFNSSWHLNSSRGINVEEAWQYYAEGEGVIVAVYDEGIDIEHEDLRGNIIGYGNYNYKTSSEDGYNPNVDGQKGIISLISSGYTLDNEVPNAPAPAPDKNGNYPWHGTACAGLIVATGDNFRGSVGVAPKSKLLAVRYSSNNISLDIKAFYAMDANGAAIISNSWGTYGIAPAFENTLRDLSENGRNGKGSLIFFAAGNEGSNMDEADINDESESPYVISIAASTQYNRIASYSNFGTSIDFAAPGSEYPASIITTDASGYIGTEGGNYTTSFSGTSAAAPIAAGVAALVLSANPTLNKEEVLEIFTYTSDKLGVYDYDTDGRNNYWGYGRINAGEAVKLATTYGKATSENFAHKIYKNMH